MFELPNNFLMSQQEEDFFNQLSVYKYNINIECPKEIISVFENCTKITRVSFLQDITALRSKLHESQQQEILQR